MPTSRELAEETLEAIEKVRRDLRNSPEKAREFLARIGIKPRRTAKRTSRRSKR